MKKVLLALILGIVFSGAVLAQNNKTKAEPIANGCGRQNSSSFEKTVTKSAEKIDRAITGKDQTKSCNQHDKDYYNGVDKKTADNKFQDRSPVMGTGVKTFESRSKESYKSAQSERKTSEKLQSTWEKEHKACLDKDNYKVSPSSK